MNDIDISLYLDKYCRILDCSGNLYVGQIDANIFQVTNEDNENEDAIKIYHKDKWDTVLIDDIFLIELYDEKK